MNRLPALVTLLRPRQWAKNGFVLAPLLFAKLFLNVAAVKAAFLAAALFCVASSSVYIVNDLRDAGYDRLHSMKLKSRPIASGAVSVSAALLLLALLYGILVVGCFFAPEASRVMLAYIALNFAYSFALKHEPIVDIFCIAIGFVLRVYAGGAALHVAVSEWMFITTLCLALYLAAVKRMQELKSSGAASRDVLKRYSLPLLERYAEMSATAAIVFYSLFVIQVRPEMAFTVPVVLFGMFRYWYVVEKLGCGESPTDALLADWQLLVTTAIWLGGCAAVLAKS